MAVYLKIDTTQMFAADWKNNGKAQFKSVVTNVKYNDDTLLKALKEIQASGKKVLELFGQMLTQVENKEITVTAFPLTLKSTERYKREIDGLVADAQVETDKFTDAMIDFRNAMTFKDGNINEDYAKRLSNLRTVSSGKAKITSMYSVKLRDAYTKRASALSKQIKVLIKIQKGEAQDTAALDKKADSLVEKVETSAAEAVEQKEYMLNRLEKIDTALDKKGPKYGLTVVGFWGDFEKALVSYKMHARTAHIQFEALKKIEAALQEAAGTGAARVDKIAEPQREINKLDGTKDALEKAYKTTAKNTNKKDVEIPLKNWKVPEFKLK